MGDRTGLGSNLRRALFMRNLRKAQEEPPEGSPPPLGLRVRYVLRLLLRDPGRSWPLPELSARVLISQSRLYDLGVAMTRPGLAEVVWFEGRRSIRLTALGVQEVPHILAQFRSQLPLVVLFRSGPRAAAFAWVSRRRNRAWQRQLRHRQAVRELEADAKPNELDLLE